MSRGTGTCACGVVEHTMTSPSASPPPRPQRYLGTSIAPERRPWVLVSAILVSAMGFIDGTILSIATPEIRAALDATLGQARWFSSAYMLPVAALILVGGAAGDRFGTDRIILIGLLIFMAASVAATLAPSAEAFILSRVVISNLQNLIRPRTITGLTPRKRPPA